MQRQQRQTRMIGRRSRPVATHGRVGCCGRSSPRCSSSMSADKLAEKQRFRWRRSAAGCRWFRARRRRPPAPRRVTIVTRLMTLEGRHLAVPGARIFVTRTSDSISRAPASAFPKAATHLADLRPVARAFSPGAASSASALELINHWALPQITGIAVLAIKWTSSPAATGGVADACSDAGVRRHPRQVCQLSELTPRRGAKAARVSHRASSAKWHLGASPPGDSIGAGV